MNEKDFQSYLMSERTFSSLLNRLTFFYAPPFVIALNRVLVNWFVFRVIF